jgi:RimJ/RimL family protein N-acetyltransferase
VHRGRRLAAPVLRKAVAHHGLGSLKGALTAYIKPENEASKKTFARAGFEFSCWAEVRGQPCLKYELLSRDRPVGVLGDKEHV